MWILVMFDLPVGTKSERRAATRFRDRLLDEGYEMSQLGIHMRFCAGKEQADRRTREIGKARPGRGEVHVLKVTDKQFAEMVVFRHGERVKSRGVPEQLALVCAFFGNLAARTSWIFRTFERPVIADGGMRANCA